MSLKKKPTVIFDLRLWFIALLVLLFVVYPPVLKGQGFSLCSVVDAKHKTMTLGWSEPEQRVRGYSFHYNGHELTPNRPTISDGTQLSYSADLDFGSHVFQVYGFETEQVTNEVEVELARPRYLSVLIPGLYQVLHRQRYVSSCTDQGNRPALQALKVAEPVVLMAGTVYATTLWLQFARYKNSALDARANYLATLRGEEFESWQFNRDKAKDLFPKAMAVSLATLTVNAVTALFMSPRGKARVKGGYAVDCAAHPDGAGLCIKL